MELSLEYTPFSQDEYDFEYKLFSRTRRSELLNIKRALTSFRYLNTSAQEARLAAVKNLLKEKS
jgi:hypothetical protein